VAGGRRQVQVAGDVRDVAAGAEAVDDGEGFGGEGEAAAGGERGAGLGDIPPFSWTGG
jgi:hypothetical protein